MTNWEKGLRIRDGASGEMRTGVLPKEELPLLAGSIISKGYSLLAPTKRGERHFFTHIAGREEAKGISLDFVRTTVPPLRKLLIPPRELLLTVENGHVTSAPLNPEGKTAVIGVHPCDLSAASLLERVYLEQPEDPYFKTKRNELTIVASNCTKSDNYCFCTSFGTGPWVESGSDVLLTDLGNRYLVEIGSNKGSELMDGFAMPEASNDDFIEKDERIRRVRSTIKRHVVTANLQRSMSGAIYNPLWPELAAKCTGCGACNMVCPTCFCFNVVDELDLDTRNVSRLRSWDGCLLWEYAEVALGGNFRRDLSARIRQFMNHKLNYWINQYGTLGCVGCGRCIEQCPSGIDITEVAAQLRG